MFYLNFFLQAGGSPIGNFGFIIIIFIIFYLFIIRPQMKKQKEETKFRSEISKGMRIVTTSGIHGKILEVGETHIILESENSRLKLDKSAVSKELSAQYIASKEEDKK